MRFALAPIAALAHLLARVGRSIERARRAADRGESGLETASLGRAARGLVLGDDVDGGADRHHVIDHDVDDRHAVRGNSILEFGESTRALRHSGGEQHEKHAPVAAGAHPDGAAYHGTTARHQSRWRCGRAGTLSPPPWLQMRCARK